jgi:glutamate dehydrogenase/leucine dehydrogenase
LNVLEKNYLPIGNDFYLYKLSYPFLIKIKFFTVKMKKIALIGSGNLAWHLGQALYHAGNTPFAVDFSVSVSTAFGLQVLDLRVGCESQ